MRTLSPRQSKVPKYLQLAELLRRQIERGELKPDDQLPSFPQLRAQHGVTNSTVEKVYGLLERDGLIVRLPSRGTFVAKPSAAPSNINQGSENSGIHARHGTIGVTGLGFSFAGNSSYWGRLLHGMREATEQEHNQLMLLDHNSFKGWEKADGVLLCDYVSEEVLQHLPPGMPRAFVITPLRGMAGVSADDYMGGRLATEHLLELGHRKIAYLHSNDPVLVPQRRRGYEDALKAAGIMPESRWTRCLSRSMRFDYGADFVNVGRSSIQDWLSEEWYELGCTALLAHNDEAAIGAIQAFSEGGLSVPADVSVIGFDGTDIGAYSAPRLTTIELPLRRIGKVATEMLLQQIGRPAETVGYSFEHRVLPIHLQVRESTAAPS